MPMISLRPLIVIPDDPFSTSYIDQTVFIVMGSALDRFRYTPDHHFYSCTFIQFYSLPQKLFRFHIDNHANVQRYCQSRQYQVAAGDTTVGSTPFCRTRTLDGTLRSTFQGW